MPRSAIATKEAIRTACRAIERAGERPTSERVRRMIGGGSMTTITRVRRELRAEMTPATGDAPESSRPADKSIGRMLGVVEGIEPSVMSVIAQAVREAQEQAIQLVEEWEARIQSIEARFAERETELLTAIAELKSRLGEGG